MDQRVHEDMQLHTHLKEAIAQGLLQLHYQPQVDVESGAVVGAEALLRWAMCRRRGLFRSLRPRA